MRSKRLFPMLGLTVVSLAGVMLGPATAAHADPFPTHTITPQVKLFTHDEEGWPFTDETASFNLDGPFGVVGPNTSPAVWRWTTGCITGELIVDVKLTVNLDVTGRVRTRTDVVLFEGHNNCTSMHTAGSRTVRDVGVGAGFNSLQPFRVNNTADYSSADIAAGDCDFADVTVTFTDN